jgi:hypothetical protein
MCATVYSSFLCMSAGNSGHVSAVAWQFATVVSSCFPHLCIFWYHTWIPHSIPVQGPANSMAWKQHLAAATPVCAAVPSLLHSSPCYCDPACARLRVSSVVLPSCWAAGYCCRAACLLSPAVCRGSLRKGCCRSFAFL